MAKETITRGAGSFSSATGLSRVLGFIRDMLLANFLGATGSSDAFFVAFRIPNLLRELFAEGSMSAAVVPVLSEVQTKEGPERAREVVRRLFTFVIITVGAFCLIAELTAPFIVKAIAPGFKGEQFSLTVFLSRIMFPFLMFVSLSALLMGALNVKKVFFVPAMASAWFNVATIVTLVVLVLSGVSPLVSAAVAITAGGIMQFLSQAPRFIREGYNFAIEFAFRDPWLKKMGLLVLPSIGGLAVTQLNIFLSTIIASFLPQGSITYLYYAMRLIQLPIGMFGVAVAVAALPTLSEHASRKDYDALKDDFVYAVRFVMFISLPAMAGLIALRVPIVSLLFQRGAFTYEATLQTAYALLFYCVGLWAMVGVRVIVSAFYSLQDTKTPVKIAALSMIVNITLSLVLMGPLKHGGLALATAVAAAVNFLSLFYLLRKKLGRLGLSRALRSIAGSALASAVMALVAWHLAKDSLWAHQGWILKKALMVSGIIVFSGALYLGLSYIMKPEELKQFWRAMRGSDR